MKSDLNSGRMGEAEKLFPQPSAPSNELDWSSPVPEENSITRKRDTSEYDHARYLKIKADPALREAYLARKRQESSARQQSRQYETERKRKWRAANPEKDHLHHKAHHAVETALRTGRLIRPNICELCGSGGKIEAHHHKGYEEKYRLTVVWLCVMCHAKQHS